MDTIAQICYLFKNVKIFKSCVQLVNIEHYYQRFYDKLYAKCGANFEFSISVLLIEISIRIFFPLPPSPTRLVGAYYLHTLYACTIFFHNNLLCSGTRSLTGGALRTGDTNGKDLNFHGKIFVVIIVFQLSQFYAYVQKPEEPN